MIVAIAALTLTPCVTEVVQARKHKHQARKADDKDSQARKADDKDSQARKTDDKDSQALKDANEDDTNSAAEQDAIVPVAPPIEHSLRVCNGYAAKKPLVVAEESATVTKDPIDYKKCADLTMQLRRTTSSFSRSATIRWAPSPRRGCQSPNPRCFWLFIAAAQTSSPRPSSRTFTPIARSRKWPS